MMMFRTTYYEVVMVQLVSQIHGHGDSGNAIVLKNKYHALIDNNSKDVPGTNYDHSGCIAMHVSV
jgi:hypothetical protein